MSEAMTQAILEALRKRAAEKGDDFELKGDEVQVRCFQPQNHQNGDSHPSAFYRLGKYVICKVCGFKEGEKKLANRLGVGVVEGGLTLSALGTVKGLPVDFLQNWGWRTQRGKDGRAKVLIPWYDESGVTKHSPAYHLRHYINKDDDTGPRFTWDLPKSTQLKPYGIWRFKEFIDTAHSQQIDPYIFITESELDTLTAWLHQIPASAIGGADGWRDDWALYFTGFRKVVIAKEHGAAGEQMVNRITQDFHNLKIHSGREVPELLVCPFPEDMKDLNALHRKVNGDKAQFQEKLKELVSQAVPVNTVSSTPQDQQQVEQAREYAELLALAKPLLHDPAILHKAICTIESLGVVGERKNIGLLRLQVRSRALPRPVNIEVNSPSSSGKTHIVVGTHTLEDASAYYEMTAGSDKALVYLDQPLKNRIIYIQEPEGLAEGTGAAIIKSLIWEGRLKYDTVVQVEGDFVGKHVEKEGPTGLIVTSTQPLDEQISNRMLRVEVDDSEDQTRRILTAIADAANGTQPSFDLKPWQAMSKILGEPARVRIVFGRFLGDRVSVTTLRIRRDFSHLLNLIAACAIEYRFQRATTPDAQILATVADYAMVHTLIADSFRAVQAEGITQADRLMVAAIVEVTTPPNGKPGEKPVTQAMLRTHLKLSKSSTSYRVNRLLSMGYLTNLEDRKGKEMKLVPGAPLPDEAATLPSPCDLAEYLVDNGFSDLVIPWIDPITGEAHDCRQHLDEKYFQHTVSSSPKHTELQPSLASKRGGSASIEPFEPAVMPESSESSRGSGEAEPPQNEAKIPQGSMQFGKDENRDHKNNQGDDWGEI